MLREQHPPDIANHIPIYGIMKKEINSIIIEELFTWKYPGLNALSLPATIVEVNARKSSPLWVMPHKISEIKSALTSLNIHCIADFIPCLINDGGASLNTKLTELNYNPLTDEELLVFMSCVGISSK